MNSSLAPLRRSGSRPLALVRVAVLGAALALLHACADSPSAPPTPASLDVVAGSGQTATVGSVLPTALTVEVTASDGATIEGVTVAFAVTAGSGTVAPASAVTGPDGRASTQLTLGETAGPVRVAATVPVAALTATFVATATARTAIGVACTAASAASLAVGQVTVLAAGASPCVAGGTAGSEFALVAFGGATNAAARSTLTVRGNGITTVTGSALAALLGSGVRLDVVNASGALVTARTPAAPFFGRLHATTERELVPRLGAARRWWAARAAAPAIARALVPRAAAVGDVVSINVNTDDACANPDLRAARVAAVSSRAIVLADTSNPAGGFTDDEYASVAATFDTLVAPLGTEAFGEPTDIDDNGHVVLFFTSAVNALTPADVGWFVGGFFWARDLFPTTATSDIGACPASNAGEMMYLLAPDPAGSINGNPWSKSAVTTLIPGIVAHEYQHLINASRRMYVNTAATEFEETWLDEGLSHVAEELAFFRATGLGPRRALDATAIRSSDAWRGAFNQFALANFRRLDDFLGAPSTGSPYADDDSLSTRGATWSFLRYAADHRTGDGDGDVWRQLVNSTTTGLATVRLVFGATETPALFRDWATSLLLDDAAGVDARWQEPSWGYRSIFDALGGGYPLATVSLADGAQRTVTLAGGGAAYLRFGVAAGQVGTVDVGTPPSSVQLTLVRTR